jgi:hypothetical protein
MVKAFDLPKMSTIKVNDVRMDEVLRQQRTAQNLLTFYRTPENDMRLLYTDFGEDEFLMMCILLHRNIEFFNFFKLIVLDTEIARENPDFTYKCLEYIKLQRTKNLKLEID